MSTQYIVKIIKETESISSEEIEGFVKIKSPSGFSGAILKLQTKENSNDETNINILNKYISKDFAEIGFYDTETTVTISLKEYFCSNKTTYRIIFDKSSKSSYNDFKKNLTNFMSTTNQTIYYKSGNEKYVGAVTVENDKMVMNGSGTLYYDNMKHSVKYTGEFEDNTFDGAGRFQNSDGNLVLVANNISNGILVQKGKLFVNFKNMSQVIDINFLDFWSKLEIDSKEDKKKLSRSNNFVEGTCKSLDNLLFEDKSVKEQHIEIWKEINQIQKKVYRLDKNNKINHDEIMNMSYVFGFISICSLMFNFILLFK